MRNLHNPSGSHIFSDKIGERQMPKRGDLLSRRRNSMGFGRNDAAAAAESPQSCPTLCDPIDSSPQAPLSLGFSRQEYLSGLPFPSPMHACMLSRFSCVQLYAILWTAAHQAPLSTGISRQENWSRLPFPSPERRDRI